LRFKKIKKFYICEKKSGGGGGFKEIIKTINKKLKIIFI